MKVLLSRHDLFEDNRYFDDNAIAEAK
jgi:hypothetical protein